MERKKKKNGESLRGDLVIVGLPFQQLPRIA